MKKYLGLTAAVLVLFGCSVQKNQDKPELFEILKQQEQGGASFRFYEIITEAKEFKMLLNDTDLKKKIKSDDIQTSNFILVNLGEKTSGGYSISVESIQETDTDIILTIKENSPTGMATTAMTYPMAVIRVNSKKNIIIN